MATVAATSFLRSLADTEKETRSKALAFLKEWLRTHHDTLTETDLLRTWKGLFYTMWHADKAPVQEELAEALAELLQCFAGSTEQGMLFLRCFFVIMQREWPGVDRFRKNKFYVLLRLVLVQMFTWVDAAAANDGSGDDGAHRWVVDDVATPTWEAVLFVLEEIVLKTPPDAIRYHMTDCYLASLVASVGSADEIDTELLCSAIEPLLDAACSSHMGVLLMRVKEGVLEPLLLEEQWAHIDLRVMTQHVFTMASSPYTVEQHRQVLYTLYRRFKRHAQKRFPGEEIVVVAPAPLETTHAEDALLGDLAAAEEEADEAEAMEEVSAAAVQEAREAREAMEAHEAQERASTAAAELKSKKPAPKKKAKKVKKVKAKRKRNAATAVESDGAADAGGMFTEDADWSVEAGGPSASEATPSSQSSRRGSKRTKRGHESAAAAAGKVTIEANASGSDGEAPPAKAKKAKGKKKVKKKKKPATPGTRKSVRISESNNTNTSASS